LDFKPTSKRNLENLEYQNPKEFCNVSNGG
jgi:hypothetical protein